MTAERRPGAVEPPRRVDVDYEGREGNVRGSSETHRRGRSSRCAVKPKEPGPRTRPVSARRLEWLRLRDPLGLPGERESRGDVMERHPRELVLRDAERGDLLDLGVVGGRHLGEEDALLC